MLVTTGEHEATRWGFRMLLEMECADILQPDIGWCGGVTELLKISALADAHGKLVVPNGSRVYSYHVVITRHKPRVAEGLMMHTEATEGVPRLGTQLHGERAREKGGSAAGARERRGEGERREQHTKDNRPKTQ